MHFEKIQLKEAMTKDISDRVRVWEVSGLHVEVENLSENLTQIKTIVSKLSPKRWQVCIEWTSEGDLGSFMEAIAEVSTFEKLQEKYPHLFELYGDLYTFS